ncbi:hypothetical protein ACFL4W_03770 [Planctomycetota bacterium]
MKELIEAHYGPISLLDIGRVPSGTWSKKSNRVKAVREAVKRLAKRPDRIECDDFNRIGLGGMLMSTKMHHCALLREAGFDVPDPADWEDKTKRIKKVRELVEKVGGQARVTRTFIAEQEPGLLSCYRDLFPKIPPLTLATMDKPRNPRAKDPEIPLLYWILIEAGYKVTPEDCERGRAEREDVLSRHGDLNHSCEEAMIDDWIYDFLEEGLRSRGVPDPLLHTNRDQILSNRDISVSGRGKGKKKGYKKPRRHVHDIIYPGQDRIESTHKRDCDFVLLPEAGSSVQSSVFSVQGGKRDPESLTMNQGLSSGLWIEYAGIKYHGKNVVPTFILEYQEKLEEKKAMAEAAGIQLVMITPKAIAEHPDKVWEEMVAKAPWLKPYTKKALNSKYLDLF